MVATEQKPQADAARVELVDNWHKQWPKVLSLLERSGQREALRVDPDGWLSARQNLLVAFVEDEVAGHLSFHVCAKAGKTEAQRPELEAHVDTFGVQPEHRHNRIEQLLLKSAQQRARELRCLTLHGQDRLIAEIE